MLYTYKLRVHVCVCTLNSNSYGTCHFPVSRCHEITNGEHVTVRSESALDRMKLTKITFPLRLLATSTSCKLTCKLYNMVSCRAAAVGRCYYSQGIDSEILVRADSEETRCGIGKRATMVLGP